MNAEIQKNVTQYLLDDNPAKALSLLAQYKDDSVEYQQLNERCRRELSGQYLYLIKEHVREGQIKQARMIIDKYRFELGNDEAVQAWELKLNPSQTSSANGNNVTSNSNSTNIPWFEEMGLKFSKINFKLIIILVAIIPFIGAFIGGFWGVRNGLTLGLLRTATLIGLLTFAIQFSFFTLLLRNAIENTEKKKIPSYLLMVWSLLTVLFIGNQLILLNNEYAFDYYSYLNACQIWGVAIALLLIGYLYMVYDNSCESYRKSVLIGLIAIAINFTSGFIGYLFGIDTTSVFSSDSILLGLFGLSGGILWYVFLILVYRTYTREQKYYRN